MRASLQRLSRMWAHWPLPAGPAVAVIGYHRVDDVEQAQENAVTGDTNTETTETTP